LTENKGGHQDQLSFLASFSAYRPLLFAAPGLPDLPRHYRLHRRHCKSVIATPIPSSLAAVRTQSLSVQSAPARWTRSIPGKPATTPYAALPSTPPCTTGMKIVCLFSDVGPHHLLLYRTPGLLGRSDAAASSRVRRSDRQGSGVRPVVGPQNLARPPWDIRTAAAVALNTGDGARRHRRTKVPSASHFVLTSAR